MDRYAKILDGNLFKPTFYLISADGFTAVGKAFKNNAKGNTFTADGYPLTPEGYPFTLEEYPLATYVNPFK